MEYNSNYVYVILSKKEVNLEGKGIVTYYDAIFASYNKDKNRYEPKFHNSTNDSGEVIKVYDKLKVRGMSKEVEDAIKKDGSHFPYLIGFDMDDTKAEAEGAYPYSTPWAKSKRDSRGVQTLLKDKEGNTYRVMFINRVDKFEPYRFPLVKPVEM